MANHTGYLPPGIVHDNPAISPTWILAGFYSNVVNGWEVSHTFKANQNNTQPVTEELANHVGVRLPGFVDDFYNRIIIDPTFINTGNLVSEQFYEISVFNGYFANKTLENIQVQTLDGLQLVGGTPPTVYGPLQTLNYQITISTDGPPSIDGNLLFDFEGTSDDITIHVTGSRIVMLPYQAALPWQEIYEWKTDVLTSNSGYEQRIRLRKNARHTLRGYYPIPRGAVRAAFNRAYGWVQRPWAVAMWSDIQYVGAINNGATSIICDTTKYDFRSNSLVCVWESHELNQVIEVTDVFAGSISLTRVMSGSFRRAYLMPVRIGIPKGGIRRLTDGSNTSLGIEYEFKDNTDLNPTAPTQFLGYDIYYDVTLMSSSELDEKIICRQDVVDFETGLVDYYPPWRYNRRARDAYFLNEDSEATWIFKKWLHRRAGRLRPYWLPTFENNLLLVAQGNVGSTLQCSSDDYRSMAADRLHLAIELTDGTWYPRTVTGSSIVNSSVINVGIDTPLNVDASRIRQICYLGLHRLDTDRVELDWIGGGVNAASIRILELKP